MGHTVTVKELNDFVEQKRWEWTRFATSARSGGPIKVLDFNADGFYRVIVDHDRTIYIGGQMETAVREYNAA